MIKNMSLKEDIFPNLLAKWSFEKKRKIKLKGQDLFVICSKTVIL